MYAVAISNNDMVYVYWYVETKIDGCLGFSVIRHDAASGQSKALPAMVGFPGDKATGKVFKDTDDWPVQKYSWKDLYAQRGGTYWYEIVPMTGQPGKLTAVPARALRTNTVRLHPEHGNCSVYFNRGIISTQAIARSLPAGKDGAPSADELKAHIAKPGDKFRARLMGDLNEGVLALLERAEKEGGECYCALYELSDKELIDHLKALGRANVHVILSNADTSRQEGKKTVKVVDGTNQDTRRDLHALGMDLYDRILGSNHIGHNKFVVYRDKDNVAQAVLAGSTNWTPTGLCAQSNNAILINSPALAQDYLDYWFDLKADTAQATQAAANLPSAAAKAKKVANALQGAAFRKSNAKERATHKLTDANGNDCGSVRVWFSPNTKQKGKAKDDPPTPPDLKEVFDLIENARQGVLFLAFIPGSPSIVTKLRDVYKAKADANQQFFVRGAATSPDPANLFKVQLFDRTMRSDANVTPISEAEARPARASAKVDSVAGVYKAFAEWEREIYKLGYAVIHDKIVVIDPFTDDCVVVTGSHNLGFKASYSNDENLLIIRGNRGIAEAYTAHVLDVYEHYRWRWRLQESKKNGNLADAWHELRPDDTWQDFYYQHKDFLAPEILFWSPFERAAWNEPPASPAVTRRRPRPARRTPTTARSHPP
jgi:phosphatidylserine/phosphatidylglycerophosphate/cardiolipin synthase-like enzyme